jgi:hypothetical protein
VLGSSGGYRIISQRVLDVDDQNVEQCQATQRVDAGDPFPQTNRACPLYSPAALNVDKEWWKQVGPKRVPSNYLKKTGDGEGKASEIVSAARETRETV